MKLAVLEVSRFDAEALRPWSSDEDCLHLTTTSLGEGDWRRTPIQVTRYETMAEWYLSFCKPIFDAGKNNEGPRVGGSEISFMAAADYALFIQNRFHQTLLRDLVRLHQEYRFDQIDFVTDLVDRGHYYDTVRVFANQHQIPLRRVRLHSHSPSNRLPRDILKGVAHWVAGKMHPYGTAYVDYWIAVVRRQSRSLKTTAIQRSQPRRDTSKGASHTVRAAMLVYDSKSWRYLLPIRQRMLEKGHETVLISPRKETDRVLRAAGASFVSIAHALPRTRLLREIERYFDSLPLGTCELNDLTDMAFNSAIRSVFKQQALGMASIYADVAGPLASILKNERINVVLGTDSGSIAGRTLFRTAELMGIPTIFIQHGALVNASHVPPYFTDARLLVWGTSSGDNLIEAGLSHAERIVCIGSPYQEEVLAKPLDSETQSPDVMVLVTFGVPGGFASKDSFSRASKEVINAAEKLPCVRFIVKPHPGDCSNAWPIAIAERKITNISIECASDTYALMRSCRVLVTMFSTTGAEAICVGKPVISINLDGLKSGLDYIASGAAYSVDKAGTLTDVLRSLIEAPPGSDQLAPVRERFAERCLHREERPAADRIVEYVEDLVTHHPATKLSCVKS
jgi:hypothetical protein